VGLLDHLSSWIQNEKYQHTRSCAVSMKKKMEEVLDQYLCIDIVVASVILDRSLDWKQIIKKQSNQEQGVNWIKNQLQKMDPKFEDSITSQGEENTSKTKGSIGRSFKISIAKDTKKNELELYFESPLPLNDQHMSSWWNEPRQKDSMPNLSELALRIFCIPGSSAESERTWSTLGRIWTPLRNRLNPETVSTLGFLKSNNDKW
jgi:hypothetical protein